MTGTIINCLTIIIGGIIGFVLAKRINKRYSAAIEQAMGIGVLMLSIVGVVQQVLTVEGKTLIDKGQFLLIVSLIIGAFAGEVLDIDGRLNRFSQRLENRFGISGFSKGFVFSTILFCNGAMSIIGALRDGLSGDRSVLMIKSALDGVSALFFTATMGIGVIASAVSVLIYQGSISLFAGVLEPFLNADILRELSLIGYAIVFCIGINLLKISKIKTANLLPALLVPVILYFVRGWMTI